MQLHLFHSPNLPIGEDQVVQTNRSQAVVDERISDETQRRPPTYGEHQFDQTYDDNGDFIRRADEPDQTYPLGSPVEMEASVTASRGIIRNNSTPFLSGLHAQTGGQLSESHEEFSDGGGQTPLSMHGISQTQHHLMGRELQRRASTGRFSNVNSSAASPEALARAVQNRPALIPETPTAHGQTLDPSLQFRQNLEQDYFTAHGSSEVVGSYDLDALVQTPSYDTALQTRPRDFCRDLPPYVAAEEDPSVPDTRGMGR